MRALVQTVLALMALGAGLREARTDHHGRRAAAPGCALEHVLEGRGRHGHDQPVHVVGQGVDVRSGRHGQHVAWTAYTPPPKR